MPEIKLWICEPTGLTDAYNTYSGIRKPSWSRECRQQSLTEVVSHVQKLSPVPWKIKWLSWLTGKCMSGEKTAEDTDSGFKYLWFCVHVERNPVDDIFNRVLETWWIIEYNEGIQYINKCQREISGNIVECYVRSSLLLAFILYMRDHHTGFPNLDPSLYRKVVRACIGQYHAVDVLLKPSHLIKRESCKLVRQDHVRAITKNTPFDM